MSEETYSPQAIAAFVRDHERQPALRHPTDVKWLGGYETCRKDNAAAMQLMQTQLDALRDREANR